KTIRSARETFFPPAGVLLNAAWISSSFANTFASWDGLLTSQVLWGSKRMRAPFAPPRLSEPRNVEAEAQAVDTNWDTDNPDARIEDCSVGIACSSSNDRSTAGIGACQISSSAGRSGPR